MFVPTSGTHCCFFVVVAYWFVVTANINQTENTCVCVLELLSGMTGYVAYSRSGPWLFGLYLSIRLTKDGVWAEQDRQRDRYFRYQIKQFLNRNLTNYTLFRLIICPLRQL